MKQYYDHIVKLRLYWQNGNRPHHRGDCCAGHSTDVGRSISIWRRAGMLADEPPRPQIPASRAGRTSAIRLGDIRCRLNIVPVNRNDRPRSVPKNPHAVRIAPAAATNHRALDARISWMSDAAEFAAANPVAFGERKWTAPGAITARWCPRRLDIALTHHRNVPATPAFAK